MNLSRGTLYVPTGVQGRVVTPDVLTGQGSLVCGWARVRVLSPISDGVRVQGYPRLGGDTRH